MIEKEEIKKIRWHIKDEDGESVAIVAVDSGEVFADTIASSPELYELKEFHQALGEAIAEAEKCQ